MEVYSVKLLPAAQSDLMDIMYHHDAPDSAESARNFEQFIRKFGSLTAKPASYAYAKDTQLRLRGYRILIIGNYMAFYVIKDDVVEVRRILFTRRHYEHLI